MVAAEEKRIANQKKVREEAAAKVNGEAKKENSGKTEAASA